jgi:hypothetical protein
LRALLPAIVALWSFSALAIWQMNSYSLWLDDLNMIVGAQGRSLQYYLASGFSGIQPPLGFMWLRLFIQLAGPTDFILRLVSILPGILAAAFVFRMGIDFSKQAVIGLWAVLLFGSMGFVRYHLHQVHIRGLVLALTMAMLFFFWRWWMIRPSRGYGVGSLISTVLLLYTHLYAIFPLAIINLMALWPGRHNFRKLSLWFGIQIAAGLLFAPYAIHLIAVPTLDNNPPPPTGEASPTILQPVLELPDVQQQQGAIIFPNTLPTDTQTMIGTINVLLSYLTPWYLALIAIGLIAMRWPILRDPSNARVPIIAPLFLTGLLIGIIALSFASNTIIQSFIDRRLIYLLPIFALLIAVMLSSTRRWLAWVLVAGMTVFAFWTGWIAGLPGNWFFRQAFETIQPEFEPADAVFFQFNTFNEYATKPLAYYADQMLPPHTAIAWLADYTLNNDFNKDVFSNDYFANYVWTRNRFWVVRSGDPKSGLVETDWISHIKGKTFEEIHSQKVGWMVVSLYASQPAVRPPMPDAVTIPDMPAMPVHFGDSIELTRYQINHLSASPEETISVRMDWLALQPILTEYAVYVHILEGDTILHGQYDGDPTHLGRVIPTIFWAIGLPIYDAATVTIDADTQPGVYAIKLGLYDRQTQARLPVIFSDGTSGDGLVLAMITVK